MSLTLTLERGGGEVSGSGTNIELDGTIAGGAIESVELNGDTQQTTYSGKNLFNKDKTLENQYIDANGSLVTGGGYSYVNQEIAATGGEKITLSFSQQVGSGYIRFAQYKSDGTFIQRGLFNTSPTTITLQANTAKVMWSVDNTSSLYFENLQIERGSTATSFEPYVGGTASPNPDYPQEVQTVTGRQVVTISDGGSQSQEYEINLGDIELCKIGTYQDYIYKSGDDWYLHKEINKYIIDGTNGNYTRITTNRFNISGWPMSYKMERGANYSISDKYITVQQYVTDGDFNSGTANMKFALGFHPLGGLRIKDSNYDDVDLYKAWVTANPISAYAVLATPTDTQITNAALISQLNALNAGTTYDGTTIITVASENLAGPLEVKASTTITKTYTEVEIGSPFTIADVEGKSSNTTLDGNVYVDWAYNKKQYSFDLFNLTPQDYADIRAYYDYQFNNSAFPTITVPELNIDKLPVYMEISSRNIINQCLLTDKLTIKFRETVQP